MATVLREYIAHFRIKELQQSLEQLGLSKRGRKLDLQNRLLAYLGSTEITAGPGQSATDIWRADAAGRVITQVWRQMHGLPDANTQSQSQTALQERITSNAEASTSSAKQAHAMQGFPPAGGYQPFHLPVPSNFLVGAHNTQINCICGDNSDRGTMVQCETRSCLLHKVFPDTQLLFSSSIMQDDSCGIWQHCACVGVDAMAMPDHYYCQVCRLALADPFWQVTDHRLLPAAVLRAVPGRPVVMRSTGKEQMMSAERSFDLTPAQLEPLRKNTSTEQLHVACLLMNDPVSNRMHWPRQAELKINSMIYRPYGRNSNTKLGNNARDEPANAAHRCVIGRNRVSLSCAEDRQFCLVAYTVRKRSLEAVKKLMAPAETPEDAVARVVSTLRGGKTGEDGDDDDDLLVSNTVISLKDPLSGTRVQIPARFSGVQGIVAFDFDNFMSMVQRSRKWQDPHTLRNVTVKQLQLDPWMQAVLTCLKDVPDVTEVEVNAEGLWRPAGADMAWLSTIQDTAPLTKAQLTKPQLAVKPDPDQASDDSEAESEGEELRKAARAFAAASKHTKAEPDVIVLDDSSDEDVVAPPRQPAAAPRHAWPVNGNTAGQARPSQQHQRPDSSRADTVPHRLHAAASAVNAGFSNSPQSSWGQASSRPAAQQAQQAVSSATGSVSNHGTAPLRIKLPTRAPDRHQQSQQGSRLARTNGSHPAASVSSGSRLADAAAHALAAQQQPQQQHQPHQQHQTRQLPTSLLGKRKQHDLNGLNGPYSQAAAQASGMSTLDQMHRATDGSAELRNPQAYSANMGYNMPWMYGPSTGSPPYWQPQMHGNSAVTSSPYSLHGMGSPGYSSGYSGLPPMQEQQSNVADAAAQQAPSYSVTDANQLLPDGDSFMDALIDWPSDKSLEGSDTGDGKRQEVRLAAWKARQGTNPQAAQQQAQDDVIVLD